MKKSLIIIIIALVLTLFAACAPVDMSREWLKERINELTTTAESAEITPFSPNNEKKEEPNNEEPIEAPKIKTGDTENTYTASEIYQNTVNSVVGITTSGTTKNIWGQVSATASTGTGIILTEDGYILTNNHVVESGDTFQVTLYDGTSYEAKLIGTESLNDVAVLKIDAKKLKAASVGNSDKIIVGEDVVVIGNPLGELTYTMTRGIVSALNRVVNTGDASINMFQMDAAVNAGNSGGPCIDAYGNIVGMVTAKYNSTSVEGIGFCIPINDAVNVANQLIQFGYVKGRAALGICVTKAYTRSWWGSQQVSGAYVTDVNKGSCAEKAGIKKGMLINYVNSTAITSPDDLSTVLHLLKSGTKITIKGYSYDENDNVKDFEITVKLDEYSPDMIPSGWDMSNGTIV